MLIQKVLLFIFHNAQGTKASVVTVIGILGDPRLAYFVVTLSYNHILSTALAIMLKQKVLLLICHNVQGTKASIVTVVASIFGDPRLAFFVVTPGYNSILFTALAIMLKQKVLLLICHSTQGTKTTIVTVTGIFASLKLFYFDTTLSYSRKFLTALAIVFEPKSDETPKTAFSSFFRVIKEKKW